MDAWIGIIGTVIGTIVGGGLGLVNTRIQMRHQDNRDKRALLLEKLEELYEALSRYRKFYEGLAINAIAKAHGAQQYSIEDIPTLPTERIQLLLRFYAPNPVDHSIQIESSSKEVLTALLKCMDLGSEPGPVRKKISTSSTRRSKSWIRPASNSRKSCD